MTSIMDLTLTAYGLLASVPLITFVGWHIGLRSKKRQEILPAVGVPALMRVVKEPEAPDGERLAVITAAVAASWDGGAKPRIPRIFPTPSEGAFPTSSLWSLSGRLELMDALEDSERWWGWV